jgi:ribosomal protein S18 acetylase RimI-like enzyme
MSLEIDTLERATLAAVPPQRLDSVDGWLLALDDGTVGRAHSAVPLRHDGLPGAQVAEIAARYRTHGLPPVFRVAQVAGLASVQDALAAAGFAPNQPTLTQVGAVDGLLGLPAAAEVMLADTPAPGWEAVFLGEGFDPVDGASRLAILRRSTRTAFASVVHDGRVVAVGSGCLAHGWCGIHGMRTAPHCRGRGLAGAILAALARAAQARGIARCFLQVDESNAGAQALYRRAGLVTAWRYAYWR